MAQGKHERALELLRGMVDAGTATPPDFNNLAWLEIVEREGLVANARVVGEHLRKRLAEGLADHPKVADVRGVGMLAAIECCEPGGKEPVGGVPMGYPAEVSHRCYDRGVIVRALWENVALAPPLCTSQEEADQIADVVVGVMHDLG